VALLGESEGVKAELGRRVAQLLEETEARMVAGSAQEWVYREARNARSLVDNRSFEQALLKRLEELVSPLLAGLLCTLDCNSNLRLSRLSQGWKALLWLALFQDDSFVHLRYNSSLFQGQDDYRTAKTEFSARRDGWEAEFPFSWLIEAEMEGLLGAERELGRETELSQRLELLQGRLEGTSWGRAVMERTLRQREKREALKAYVHDLIHLRFKTSGLGEFELRIMMEAGHQGLPGFLRRPLPRPRRPRCLRGGWRRSGPIRGAVPGVGRCGGGGGGYAAGPSRLAGPGPGRGGPGAALRCLPARQRAGGA
jgi:hypothetical protein